MSIDRNKYRKPEPPGGSAPLAAKPLPSIVLTEPAIVEIRRRMSSDPSNHGKKLRLWVEAGGCSGLSYEMAFVAEKKDGDVEFNFDGLVVQVDGRSMSYINGMTLDFSDKMVNGGFQFSNPKAKRSCGCGTSFSV
ncbi:MAG: iron-sulfur cluster assembly accessory protein [Candidatus Zixiibacteriota bacterium]